MVNAPSTFPGEATRFLLRGEAGAIETAVAPPLTDPRRGTAIVCHPHPLHGGTMQNKVVTTLERGLRELGLRCVRFNFRGVGASEGSYDDGIGETRDLVAVARWVRSVRADDVLWLAGFSFGSYVAAHAAAELAPAQLISIAPPVERYGFASLPRPACPWLVVQGEEDDVASPDAVYAWLATLREPPGLVRIAGTGHFFHGRLLELRDAIKQAVSGNLPPLAA